MLRLADLHESNHQLESRVREIRLPGSEGGALVTNVPTPIPRGRQTLPKIMRPFRLGRHPMLMLMRGCRTATKSILA